MKQRARVLLTLFSASLLISCLSLALGPMATYASTHKNASNHQSPSTQTATTARRDHDDDLLPLRNSHFTLHTMGNGNNLGYGGGPVMTGTMHTYAIFWEPNGNVDAHYNSLIQRYFGDIGGSPLYKIAGQYKQANGAYASNSVHAASWVDSRPYPHQTVLDGDIKSEVRHAQHVNGWHSSLHNMFFVFTGRHVNVCTDSSHSQCTSNGFCAYHSAFNDNTTVYAAIPYIASFRCDPYGGPNHDDVDKTITGVSHEQMEAATDPLGNAWLDSQGNEVADKCEQYYGQPNAQGADVIWHGDPYRVQEEWDNHSSSCRLTPSSHHQNSPSYPSYPSYPPYTINYGISR